MNYFYIIYFNLRFERTQIRFCLSNELVVVSSSIKRTFIAIGSKKGFKNDHSDRSKMNSCTLVLIWVLFHLYVNRKSIFTIQYSIFVSWFKNTRLNPQFKSVLFYKDDKCIYRTIKQWLLFICNPLISLFLFFIFF